MMKLLTNIGQESLKNHSYKNSSKASTFFHMWGSSDLGFYDGVHDE